MAVTVAFERVDLSAESFVSFGGILDYYFEVTIVLKKNIIHQALSVFRLLRRLLLIIIRI